MGTTLIVILQGIQAALSAAPQVEAVITAAKEWLDALADNGVIPSATQNALHAWVDTHAEIVAAGITPPAWQVQPDPAPGAAGGDVPA